MIHDQCTKKIGSLLRRGWEGPPHNLGYEVVGAHLTIGFKKEK